VTQLLYLIVVKCQTKFTFIGTEMVFHKIWILKHTVQNLHLLFTIHRF